MPEIKTISEESEPIQMSADQPPKLLIPGPIQPERSVLDAMGSPVKAHYGEEWTELYNHTVGLMKEVFRTDGVVHLLVGSGSAGIDACIGSAVPPGGKIIIGINGFFGERMRAIARGYGLDVVEVRAEWGSPIQAEDVERAMVENPDARVIAFVHLETSTTITNPVADIGRLSRAGDRMFIVDAVSSLGGMTFNMDAWGVDYCISASQKCLGAPPGLAPVAIGERGIDHLYTIKSSTNGWYLNLRVWQDYAHAWADWHPFPITMATNNVLALRESVAALLEEGVAAREASYRELALQLRQGIRDLGLKPFTPDSLMSPVITAAYGPPGSKTGEIVRFLLSEYNVKIAGGIGEGLKDKIFRIGHMAPSTSREDIQSVLHGLGAYIDSTTS